MGNLTFFISIFVSYLFIFYKLSEKIKLYEELRFEAEREYEKFRERWPSEKIGIFVKFHAETSHVLITERSRHEWGAKKMTQFAKDFFDTKEIAKQANNKILYMKVCNKLLIRE